MRLSRSQQSRATSETDGVEDDERQPILTATEHGRANAVEVLADAAGSIHAQRHELAVNDAVLGNDLDELPHNAPDAIGQLRGAARPAAPPAASDRRDQSISVPFWLEHPSTPCGPIARGREQHRRQRSHATNHPSRPVAGR
jgi:hypothetical protein